MPSNRNTHFKPETALPGKPILQQLPPTTHQIPAGSMRLRPIYPRPRGLKWYSVAKPPTRSTNQALLINRNAHLLSPHVPVLNLPQCHLVPTDENTTQTHSRDSATALSAKPTKAMVGNLQVYSIFQINTAIYPQQVGQSGNPPIHAYGDEVLLDDHAFQYLKSLDNLYR